MCHITFMLHVYELAFISGGGRVGGGVTGYSVSIFESKHRWVFLRPRDNFQLCLWIAKQVFLATTWCFLNPAHRKIKALTGTKNGSSEWRHRKPIFGSTKNPLSWGSLMHPQKTLPKVPWRTIKKKKNHSFRQHKWLSKELFSYFHMTELVMSLNERTCHLYLFIQPVKLLSYVTKQPSSDFPSLTP